MNKLEGIKEGDTVEVTFRATVWREPPEYMILHVEGAEGRTAFDASDIASPHFSIKRIERPLEVGDRVTDCDGQDWEVVAPPREWSEGVEVGVWNAEAGYAGRKVSDLERVS